MINDLFPEVLPTPDDNRRYTTRALMDFVKRLARVSSWDLDPDADLESHHAPRYYVAPGDVVLRDGLLLHPPCTGIALPGTVCGSCSRRLPLGVDSLAHSWLAPRDLNEWRDGEREDRWRIYDNPPFDNIGPRIAKVWETLEQSTRAVVVAMVMPGNRGEQPFWQDLVEPFLAGHARDGRCGYRLTVHHPPGRQAYGYPGNPLGIGSSSSTPWPTAVLLWRRM